MVADNRELSLGFRYREYSKKTSWSTMCLDELPSKPVTKGGGPPTFWGSVLLKTQNSKQNAFLAPLFYALSAGVDRYAKVETLWILMKKLSGKRVSRTARFSHWTRLPPLEMMYFLYISLGMAAVYSWVWIQNMQQTTKVCENARVRVARILITKRAWSKQNISGERKNIANQNSMART